MDYQVFLLSRIRERYDEVADTAGAVRWGVTYTARIITGAALTIVAVFSGFARGDLVMFQQMGFGVAVALLLDATVIRSCCPAPWCCSATGTGTSRHGSAGSRTSKSKAASLRSCSPNRARPSERADSSGTGRQLRSTRPHFVPRQHREDRHLGRHMMQPGAEWALLR
jgi:hypothetical protein